MVPCLKALATFWACWPSCSASFPVCFSVSLGKSRQDLNTKTPAPAKIATATIHMTGHAQGLRPASALAFRGESRSGGASGAVINFQRLPCPREIFYQALNNFLLGCVLQDVGFL